MTNAERLLDGLDPEQREVATALEGPVRVLAGAGTGKTRAITHRLAYAIAVGAVEPTRVLAVTFTTRAAGEMRTRLTRLGAGGVQARTFHSAALRQARFFWPQVYGRQLPEIAKSKVPLVAEAARRCRLRATQPDLRDLAGEIEWAKVSNVRPDDYARLAPGAHRALASYDAPTVAQVFAAYEAVRQERNRIDMEDVLLCTVALLSDDQRVADAVRRQYSWFVVDEFQDVSPVQSRLLDLWLGDRSDVCVVGDPAQTIYSFAGASADYLLEFPRHHPGTTTVTLQRNYRSTPEVIGAANAVMSLAPQGGSVRLQPTRESGVPVAFTGVPDEVDEARRVADAIARDIDAGVEPGRIAVLFRINAQSEALEDALADRGIAFVVRGGDRFFDRSEVRQAVALLRGAARAPDGESAGLVADVQHVLSTMGWSAEAPRARGSMRDRWESLQAMVGLAEEHAGDNPDDGLAEFVEELRRRIDAQQAPLAEGVTLATLHAAKGLEWSVVYLIGIHEGSLPIVYAETAAQVEEERRLLYVGMTRARDRLEVSWAAARTPGGRGQRGPSRFLDPVVSPEQRRPASTGGRRRGRAASVVHCRVCGTPLGDTRERKLGRCADCPSSYDEALFEELRAWRKERASAEGVPAYCVFTDATLTALAETRPTDERGLVAVPGIGATKLSKYGADVLAMCSAGNGSATAG